MQDPYVRLIAGVVFALAAHCFAAETAYFEGDSVRLRLSDAGNGSLTGTLTHNGNTYPLTAQGKLEGQVKGSFTANNSSYEFIAQSTADGLTLESGGKTYGLKRAAAPAVVPARITYKPVEIRDINLGNMISHTMFVPEGWTFEGQTHWSDGVIIYPQQTITARSPEGYETRFVPAMHLGYSEMDPNFILQLKQSGLWNPEIHKERTGIPPPTDIGEFLIAFIQRNNNTVSDVRLIEQKRDRDNENALRQAGIFDNNSEMHIINIEYKRNGAVFREEINLTYNKMPVMRLQTGTMATYSIATGAVVAGPAEGFAKAKPLLYAIANSLNPTAEWHYASQDVLVQIQNARHEANMEGIRRWGDAMRKAAEQNAKISEARLTAWKEDQKVKDAKHRDFIQRIYDIYTHTTATGAKVGVPLGHNHLFQKTDGSFVSSQHPIHNSTNQGLTPVDMK